MAAPQRAFTARHVHLVRALFAAAAALMITFSPDHSAAIGLAVFGGYVAACTIIYALGAWLVAEPGERWWYILLAVIGAIASFAAAIEPWRVDAGYFAIVIAWAAASGLVELIAELRAPRESAQRKDAVTMAIVALLLAVVLLAVLLLVQPVDYSIEGAGDFTLTPIILGVGMFGGYAAIVAVFLAIAGLTPQRTAPVVTEAPAQEAPTAEGSPA